MSKRQRHVRVGTLTGYGFAAYRAREQEPLNMLLEAIGGGVGGYVGSRLPDIIEPASWPGHRQFAHSVTAGSSIAYYLYRLLEEWEEYFRSQAKYYNEKKSEEDGYWFQKLLYAVLEIFFRIVAGSLGGLGAGYVSHLALDGRTPKGLPVVN